MSTGKYPRVWISVNGREPQEAVVYRLQLDRTVWVDGELTKEIEPQTAYANKSDALEESARYHEAEARRLGSIAEGAQSKADDFRRQSAEERQTNQIIPEALPA